MFFILVAHSYLLILVRVICHCRKIPEFKKSVFLHHLGRDGVNSIDYFSP